MANPQPKVEFIKAIVQVILQTKEEVPVSFDPDDKEIDFGTAWRSMISRLFGPVSLVDVLERTEIKIFTVTGINFAPENAGPLIGVDRNGMCDPLPATTRGFIGAMFVKIPLTNDDIPENNTPERILLTRISDDFLGQNGSPIVWDYKTELLNGPSYLSYLLSELTKSLSDKEQLLVMTIYPDFRHKPTQFHITLTTHLISALAKREGEELVWENGATKDRIALQAAMVLSSEPYVKNEFCTPLKIAINQETSPVKFAFTQNGSGIFNNVKLRLFIPGAFRVSKLVYRDMETVLSNCGVGNGSPSSTLDAIDKHPRKDELVNLVAQATIFITKLHRDTAKGSRLISPHIIAESDREQQAAYVKIHAILLGPIAKKRRGILPVP